jgi:hypothetical protein
MFCGFGAVVLFVLIINSNIVSDNKEQFKDLTSEVEHVEIELIAAKRHHRYLQDELEKVQEKKIIAQSEINELDMNISEIEKQTQLNQKQTIALKKNIKQLQSDLKQLDKNNSTKKSNIKTQAKDSGNKIRQYEGEGNRQYLTGLKLGGKRVVILLDSSASMLDETIVNVIIKRNYSNDVKRSTRKWQQAINIVQWITANLPKNSQFIITKFNEEVTPLTKNQTMAWVNSLDQERINNMINNLFKIVPEKGTNLYKAFRSIKKMNIRPDNIILITDGLPTQGATKVTKSKVSSAERIDLFRQAVKTIPKGIPVNTILLPMEGDPMAASLFWELAIDTKGSFLTPSRDWP